MSTCTGVPYSQLSEEAKERAVEWWQEQAASEACLGLSDLLEQELEYEYGITDCKLYGSLNYCQGDGVAFEGRPDLEEWAKHDEQIGMILAKLALWCAAFRWEMPTLHVSITHCGRYYHWNSMDVRIEEEWEDNGDLDYPELGDMGYELIRDLESCLDDAVKDISRKLEKTGYAEIEYQQSEECAKEALENCDDWLFDPEDGEFIG